MVSASSAGVLNVHEMRNVPLLVQNEERVQEIRSFDWGPLPPLCLPSRHNVIHVIKWTRPSLCFCILQAIKNWRREWCAIAGVKMAKYCRCAKTISPARASKEGSEESRAMHGDNHPEEVTSTLVPTYISKPIEFPLNHSQSRLPTFLRTE